MAAPISPKMVEAPVIAFISQKLSVAKVPLSYSQPNHLPFAQSAPAIKLVTVGELAKLYIVPGVARLNWTNWSVNTFSANPSVSRGKQINTS